LLLELQQYLGPILDLFCHISQHDHKISPVSKKITHVCRHAKTTGAVIVAYCYSYPGKVTRTAPNAEQISFTDSKTELGAFFIPNTRVNNFILKK